MNDDDTTRSVPGGSTDSLRPDDRRAAPETSDAPEVTPASGPLMFVPFLILLLGGFWLMGYAFDTDNGVLWWVGLVASGLAFLIPLQARD